MIIKISVEGYDDAVKQLRQAPRILSKHLRRAMDRSVKMLQWEVQRYPPPPPASSYRRTGTLGRKWVSKVDAKIGNVQGILENPVHYAPLVQGDETQAQMHRGRWPTVGQAAEKQKRKLEGIFRLALGDAVREMENV